MDVAFLDGDKKIDVIVRHLGNENELLLYFQNSPDEWQAGQTPRPTEKGRAGCI